MPELRRYHAGLLCRLSNDEIRAHGQELAVQVQACVDEEIRQGVQRKLMKETLDRLEAERDRLAGIVALGAEKREVECVVQADYTTNKAYTMRMDTGEVIDERALKADELQIGLDIAATDAIAEKMHLRTGDGSVVGEPRTEA